MDEQELCKKRLVDLSRQADTRDIVTFSDFLNLNEQNIYHSNKSQYYTISKAFGGYENAERQMIAFIPDALCYEWTYPICCICVSPLYPKYAEKLTHRDILGALMSLGITRGKLGDIICHDSKFYVFAEEQIADFIATELTQIKHTTVQCSFLDDIQNLDVSPEYEEHSDMIASNRIDCIIAKAYHLSRSQASDYLISEKVFVNGKCITNCNQGCDSGCIISVRGKGRFRFETAQALSKKGKLKVSFYYYK